MLKARNNNAAFLGCGLGLTAANQQQHRFDLPIGVEESLLKLFGLIHAYMRIPQAFACTPE